MDSQPTFDLECPRCGSPLVIPVSGLGKEGRCGHCQAYVKAGVSERYKDGQTLLHLAVAKGDTETVKLLAAKGADIHCRDARGLSPLDLAALRADKRMLDALEDRRQQGAAALPRKKPALARFAPAAVALLIAVAVGVCYYKYVAHGATPEQEPVYLFYSPLRQPAQAWKTGEDSYYPSLLDAVKAFGRQYKHDCDWVVKNMGESNDLRAIHQNLGKAQLADANTPGSQPAQAASTAQNVTATQTAQQTQEQQAAQATQETEAPEASEHVATPEEASAELSHGIDRTEDPRWKGTDFRELNRATVQVDRVVAATPNPTPQDVARIDREASRIMEGYWGRLSPVGRFIVLESLPSDQRAQAEAILRGGNARPRGAKP